MHAHDYIIGSDTDHYDAEEVFGDDIPKHPRVSREDLKHAVREIVRQAQKSRQPPPPVRVEPIDAAVDMLGDLGNSKIVRMDTEQSYADFMAKRRAPYLAILEQRLDHLEAAFKTHVAEGHGGLSVRQEDLEVLGEDVREIRDQAKIAGSPVPLSLPPWAIGKVRCWQDGTEIYCSLRCPGPDGQPRIATTSTSAEKYVDEALGYATDTNAPEEIIGMVPILAQILGGGALVTQLSRAAPGLLSRSEVPFVARITEDSDVT